MTVKPLVDIHGRERVEVVPRYGPLMMRCQHGAPYEQRASRIRFNACECCLNALPRKNWTTCEACAEPVALPEEDR